MAEAERERWNARYRADDYAFAPAAWLRELERMLREHPPGARALDLACGGGRNALYLAELGYVVDAWDISDVGLDLLRNELAQRAEAGEALMVSPLRLDLEAVPLPANTYDLVLDAHYLERSLFPSMKRALRPRGRLIVRTFLHVRGGPITERLSNPAYALQPGELASAFGDLEILQLTENASTETAHILARRPRVTPNDACVTLV
jgi:SAM-dependent methyltransferase